jgi:hypothetical protein
MTRTRAILGGVTAVALASTAALATGSDDVTLPPLDKQPPRASHLKNPNPPPQPGPRREATPPEGDLYERETALKTLESAYSLLRRAANADESKYVRKVKFHATEPATLISVTGLGLCIQPAFGGTACGDPEEALTNPPMLTAASPREAYTAGPVPDDVVAVEVTSSTETQKIKVKDNLYEAHVQGELARVVWFKKDGTVEQKLPHPGGG